MLSHPDILVVNDRPLDSQITMVALELVAPRARVLLLQSGAEAVEYLFATGEYRGRAPGSPRLTLLTLGMNNVSGLCVLDLMRAHPSTCRIPVVLFGLEADIRKYRRHDRFDADAYLTEPCDFQRYCAVLRGCVGHWLPWALPPAKEAPIVSNHDRWTRRLFPAVLQAAD
ncbi:hypothetical protein JM946_12570 [Steroidobacter sp. S1-65]|uniref:Response regulatory domain-containing protein n=1 Tax=Steroidobacter gossypii TaxID=2805490 RepID=A0ABS1WX83_9GAMM|nr:hypothetical protein [Steroidobacter gossypii]MBM0105592.1 hypothetical protein [Steroidobacter gossypii]